MTGGDAAVDAAVGTGGRKGPVEPPGPLAVSIVNGVTDAPWISLCFTKVTDGVESSLHGKPFPSASLAYGKSLTVSSLPGVDFASDAVRPYVIAASPDAISGLDCASIFVIAGVLVRESAPDGAPSNAVDGSVADAARDASFDVSGDGRPSGLDAANPVDARTTPDGAGSSRDAAPAEGGPAANHGKVPVPIIRVSPLYVIPAGTFTAARHYLFALGGCLGGPGITDPSERSVCGENYSATHPTLIPVLLTLSRITTSGRVGIQFVDASPPVRAADLHLTSKGLSTLTVVTNSVIGAIRPEPPNTARPSTDYAPSDHIQIFADASPQPIYDAPWSKTLAVGDLSSLADGHTYTLLLVGPYPGFSQREWWNDPLVTVIENDR